MIILALKRIVRVGVRSWGVALAALLVASFVLGVLQVLLGMQDSLNQAINRLGADILVVPEGVMMNTESAMLMGISDQAWMPRDVLEGVSAVPGVSQASPQLYLSTLDETSCCPTQEILLIAYDPETDFTIRPWFKNESQPEPGLGEAVAGSEIAAIQISNPLEKEALEIGGYPLQLVADLESTGTRLDKALFVSFETASELAEHSDLVLTALGGGVYAEISAVMVQIEEGADPYETALELMHAVPGINPITNLELFQAYRQQLSALLVSVFVVTAITLVVSLLLTGLIFSMAANERRVELGVMRALGATRLAIFQSLILEVSLLAFGGGLVGGLLTGVGLVAFRHIIIEKLEIPFLPPSSQTLMLQLSLGLAAAIFLVTAAVLLPAYRISREEPAFAMRE